MNKTIDDDLGKDGIRLCQALNLSHLALCKAAKRHLFGRGSRHRTCRTQINWPTHCNWRADRGIKKRCAIKTRTSDVEICLLKNPQVKYRQVSKGKIEAVKYCEPK